MQVRCWLMEWTSWSFLRKPVAQMAWRVSMMKPRLGSLRNQPAPLSWSSALVWWCHRSAVSSCLNSP